MILLKSKNKKLHLKINDESVSGLVVNLNNISHYNFGTEQDYYYDYDQEESGFNTNWSIYLMLYLFNHKIKISWDLNMYTEGDTLANEILCEKFAKWVHQNKDIDFKEFDFEIIEKTT